MNVPFFTIDLICPNHEYEIQEFHCEQCTIPFHKLITQQPIDFLLFQYGWNHYVNCAVAALKQFQQI